MAVAPPPDDPSRSEEEGLVEAVQLAGNGGLGEGRQWRNKEPRGCGPTDRTIQRATVLAQKGNLGKAMTELTECGLADDPDDVAVPILNTKHPPCPAGQPAPVLGRRPAGGVGFEWLTRANLCKVALASKFGGATDQWASRVRELWGQWLQDEAIGDCMTAYVFAPIAFGTGLAAFDDYVIGGRLIGVRKPNGGIRPILIGD